MPIPTEIKASYAELRDAPPEADASWRRARGYKLESLLLKLLQEDGLDPRASYRTTAEQIDGSFFFDGTVFLLEAKWQSEPIPASVLYQFKGKVDGKLVGTLGVFLSMSGYSSDAGDALTAGKRLNLILFDKRDMDAAIDGDLGFRQVLKKKLRKAAEEGVVYFPTTADLVSTREPTREVAGTSRRSLPQRTLLEGMVVAALTDATLILCEGDTDRQVITLLAKRILERTSSKRVVEVISGFGKNSLGRLANAIDGIRPASRLLIVVDGDNEVEKTRQMLETEVAFKGWQAIIPNPTIEVWLNLDPTRLQSRGFHNRLSLTLAAADGVDIDGLRTRDASFAQLYDAIAGV